MNYAQRIASRLGLRSERVAAAIELFDAGNTLPFIARYRKEVTGGLDEDQLRQLSKLLDQLRALDDRRQTILATIEEQGKLTPELRQQIMAAESLTELEDLYRPYKPKRRTRATIAREKGLQGLADLILQQPLIDQPIEQIAAPFLSDEVESVEDALAGARDIVAETISDHPDVRQTARDKALHWATLRTEKKDDVDDPRATYRLYYEFKRSVNQMRPHQTLALNRGEEEDVLRVRVAVAERDWRAAIEPIFRANWRSPLADQLAIAVEDAAQRLLLPAIERDVRRALTERAEAHAIRVFANNLRSLLNQPPLTGHTILGIDPGFRTGCKVAVVDPSGKVLDTATIYPHEPQKQRNGALNLLKGLVAKHAVTLIAIGNGTASRETEQLVADLIQSSVSILNSPFSNLKYLIVSEAGASVYSASPLARAELPDMDVSMRGAVSIARRVQDPLAELVKIDPQSLGVGMYQHDVNQTQLAEALDDVVESVVNRVGVDLNTASPALLTHVAGIGPTLSKRIVGYRDEHGPFSSRKGLKKVSGIGPKTFEQAAGFLRVPGGKNPMDASAIHPESYAVAKAVLKRAGLTLETPPEERGAALVSLLEQHPLDELAQELDAGAHTLSDIFEQLVRPGRDPRDELPAPILRSDVLTMDDLTSGMRLKGTVRNVVDFGAFIDIGVKNDGLLHRSQIPIREDLRVGDVIEVKIVKVEPERGRIGLGWAGPEEL